MKNKEKRDSQTLEISAKAAQFKKHQKHLRLNQNKEIEKPKQQKENNNESMRKRSRMTQSVEPVKVEKVLKRIQKKKDSPQPQTSIKQRRLRQRVISLKVATEDKKLMKNIKNAKISQRKQELENDPEQNGSTSKSTRERQQQVLSETIPNGIKEGKRHENEAKCDIVQLVQLKQKIMKKFSDNKWSQIDLRNTKLKEKAQMIIEQKPELKLNLILDLDETLVNSVWENSENRQLLRPYSESCHKNILNNSAANRSKGISSGQVSVLRPHLREFLQSVGEFFKVYVYSHGKKDYVAKLIEKLNVRRDILDPSRTFKNEGQVSATTQKDIRNIFPVKSKNELEDILKATVIVDDFIDIWQHETQKNIVPIKRFQPLVEISKKENRSTLAFASKDNTISFTKSQSYYFQDLDYNDHSNNYLNYLSRYLCALASSHYINLIHHPKHNFDIREEMLAAKFSLFNKQNMFIDLLAKEKIYEASKYIVLMTGAQIVNSPKEASIALIVPSSFHSRQKEIIAVKKEHPKIVLVDVKWVIDSFYLHTQLDMNLYSL